MQTLNREEIIKNSLGDAVFAKVERKQFFGNRTRNDYLMKQSGGIRLLHARYQVKETWLRKQSQITRNEFLVQRKSCETKHVTDANFGSFGLSVKPTLRK